MSTSPVKSLIDTSDFEYSGQRDRPTGSAGVACGARVRGSLRKGLSRVTGSTPAGDGARTPLNTPVVRVHTPAISLGALKLKSAYRCPRGRVDRR